MVPFIDTGDLFDDITSFPIHSPVQQVFDQRLVSAEVELWIKREDLIHPQVSGNKWRKLKYNLIEARKLGKSRLLSFGGAYSNHLLATAAAGAMFNFETVGIVRGEQQLPLNPRLLKMEENGMTLRYMDRSSYRRKNESAILQALAVEYPNSYFIPEGGSNRLAVEGVREMIAQEPDFDYYCTACGSAGTTAGLLAGTTSGTVVSVAVLKGAGFLRDDISRLLGADSFDMLESRLDLQLDYHFGGYAKTKEGLRLFVKDFSEGFAIPIEPIYTGKMFYGLFDLIGKNYFTPGSRILAIHTGGLY